MFQVENQIFCLLLLAALLLFRLIFFIFPFVFPIFFLALLLFLLSGFFLFFPFFKKRQLFFAHTETFVSILIKEHNIFITLRSPGTMTTIPRTVTLENHGFSIQYPFRTSLRITTIGQIMNLSLSISFDQSNILAVPATDTDIFCQNPFSIRTPCIILITIGIRILELAIHHRTYFLTLQIQDTNFRPVFQKGHFTAFWIIQRLKSSIFSVRQTFFTNTGTIRKILLLFLSYRCLINLPHSITF